MALIKCPECQKEISDTVDECIHCGYKLKKIVENEQSLQNQGLVTIHGYQEWYINNPRVKIYSGETLIGDVGRNEIWKNYFESDTILNFRYAGKNASIKVTAFENKEIFLSLNRVTGSLIATTTDNDFSQSNSIIKNYTKEEYSDKINSPKKKSKIITIIVVLLVLWYVGIFIYSKTPMNDDKACIYAKGAVRDRMREPSSAKFDNNCSVTKNNNLWTVSGTVHGRNGFGGMSSQRYIVIMEIDGSEHRIISISFD